jgi:hypothetical protein
MTQLFRARLGGARSPLSGRLVKRPSFVKNMTEVRENNKLMIDPPRFIKLGIDLDPITGEELGPFYLPFDSREHEPAMLIFGGSGSGKSTCLARIHSELSFQYSRSQTIFDFKNQYKLAYMPNDNPKHIEILNRYGEVPRGVPKVQCFLPSHIVDRWGEDYCMANYNYTDTWKMGINDVDPSGLLMLGQKETENRGYVNMLDAIMAVIRKRDGKITIGSLKAEIEANQDELSGAKRSGDALLMMIDSLVKLGVLADVGNDVLTLMHPPRRPGIGGDFFVFNLSGAGPDDIQTKGILINMINAICHRLITNLHVQPVIGIEEASSFFGKDSAKNMLSALSQMHYVVGRSEGIFRIYVYQKKEQVPLGIEDDKGTPLVIETVNNFTLGNGQPLFGAGFAKVTIKDMIFMPSDNHIIRVLPPRCKIIS